MPYNTSKGNAIVRMCKLYNTSIAKTVGFGDHYNDVSMLDKVNVPFIMKNASEGLKKNYKNIALSNNEEAIYDGLAKLNIIKKDV